MISRRLLRIAAPLLAVGIAVSVAGCSDLETNDAASITYSYGAGTHTIHITRDDLNTQLRQLSSNVAFMNYVKANFPPALSDYGNNKTTLDADFTASWLSTMLELAIYDNEFKAHKLTVSASDLSAARTSAEKAQEFGGQAIFDKLPKGLQNTIVEGFAHLTADSSVCLSEKAFGQIFVASKAQADQVIAQLKAGANFGDIARARSLDTATASQGGFAGCLTLGAQGQFSDEIAHARFDTPLGPFSTGGNAYAIAMVSAWDPSLASTAQIKQTLASAAPAFVAYQLAHAKVYVDPRYGTWGPVSDGQGGTVYEVTPPNAPSPREQREKNAPTTTTTTPSALGG
jgi:hypothetical protein